MFKKILPILLIAFTLTACEAPIDESGTSANDGAMTNGSGMDGGAIGNADGSLGSEMQGMGGGELAPGVRDTVYFMVDSSAIEGDAQTVLEKQAGYLKANAGVNILVEGHCDERGTREYNLALGERRANSIKQFLVSQGVEASRINTISYGKERPVAEGSDESAWNQNRRGVTVKR